MKPLLEFLASLNLVFSFLAGVLTTYATLHLWWRRRSPLGKFIGVLASMEKWHRRAKQDAAEKRKIGRVLAKEITSRLSAKTDNQLTVFIESGTTMAEIGFALLHHDNWNGSIKILTNNLLVALILAGTEKETHCSILKGDIDKEYPGIVGSDAVELLIKRLPSCDLAIMDTTTFDTLEGPQAGPSNRDIKKTVLNIGTEVFLCFSSSKILGDSKRRNNPPGPVLDRPAWYDRLKTCGIHLAISEPSAWKMIRRSRFKERLADLEKFIQDQTGCIIKNREINGVHLLDIQPQPDRAIHASA